ncbi:MAG TPA: NAD(P)H-binding protein [Candidatus Limnocylindria bacterium]|nr:NAD(P)H-binding protein [Candidatus Limnocylindria bacterium]
MNILLTGVSGYVGSRLVPRLLADGHTVRGFSRRRDGPAPAPFVRLGIDVVTGDAVSGAGLDQAFDGVEAAYFLIHSMEPSPNGPFAARERAAAENFAAAARAAGTGRIIYLGGPIPEGGPASAHLTSRLGVERILMAASPCSVAFRASIVIGAQSRPFRLLVRLVERMPVLAVPAWRTHRTNPIDERDMVELLARAATSDAVCGQTFEIGGPETVSYGELIDRIRDHLLVSRPTISLRRITATPIASRLAALIAGEQHALIGPLMESLDDDLVLDDSRAADLLGVRLHSLDAAIEHALREWEAVERLVAR